MFTTVQYLASEPKWVNLILNIIGINSLRLGGPQLNGVTNYHVVFYINFWFKYALISHKRYSGTRLLCFGFSTIVLYNVTISYSPQTGKRYSIWDLIHGFNRKLIAESLWKKDLVL